MPFRIRIQVNPLLENSYSEDLIHVQIPESVPTGLYALFVKCGEDISEHVWINRADTWQVLDIAGTQIDPNREFRIYG